MSSEPILYIRGYPKPPSDANILSSERVEQLKVLTRLDDGIIAEFQAWFESMPGFLDWARLKDGVHRLVGDNPNSDEIANAFWMLLVPPFDVDRVEFATRIPAMLRGVDDDDDDEGIRLSEDEIHRLELILPSLVRSVPAADRQKKARRLQEETGQTLASFSLICDARPVFDSKREVVEGWIPLTHLKLVRETASGMPDSVEAVLSEEQVRRLHEATKQAISKLECIRKMADAAEIPIPLVRMTRKGE